MLENLLQLDLLLDQYRLASGHEMPEDLVVATVLRCVTPNVRQHLELTLDDKVDYQALKEKLILMDKNSKAWSGDTYLKMVQNSMGVGGNNGPTPMEVDQVGQVKGKDKGGKKGSKGKKGNWFPFGFSGGKYGGKSYKGKGKKGSKGKKGGKKGKGKYGGRGKVKGGMMNNNTCRVCGQQGHWGNECPNRAQAVTQQTLAESEIASSAGGKRSTTTSSVASTNVPKTVRQVTLYHVATPRDEEVTPALYEIQSEGGESWISDDHYQVNVVSFSIGHDSETEESFDHFMEGKALHHGEHGDKTRDPACGHGENVSGENVDSLGLRSRLQHPPKGHGKQRSTSDWSQGGVGRRPGQPIEDLRKKARTSGVRLGAQRYSHH